MQELVVGLGISEKKIMTLSKFCTPLFWGGSAFSKGESSSNGRAGRCFLCWECQGVEGECFFCVEKMILLF